MHADGMRPERKLSYCGVLLYLLLTIQLAFTGNASQKQQCCLRTSLHAFDVQLYDSTAVIVEWRQINPASKSICVQSDCVLAFSVSTPSCIVAIKGHHVWRLRKPVRQVNANHRGVENLYALKKNERLKKKNQYLKYYFPSRALPQHATMHQLMFMLQGYLRMFTL